eukprot:scaffold2706_cov109-Isochrysis_galbana.AAC.12
MRTGNRAVAFPPAPLAEMHPPAVSRRRTQRRPPSAAGPQVQAAARVAGVELARAPCLLSRGRPRATGETARAPAGRLQRGRPRSASPPGAAVRQVAERAETRAPQTTPAEQQQSSSRSRLSCAHWPGRPARAAGSTRGSAASRQCSRRESGVRASVAAGTTDPNSAARVPARAAAASVWCPTGAARAVRAGSKASVRPDMTADGRSAARASSRPLHKAPACRSWSSTSSKSSASAPCMCAASAAASALPIQSPVLTAAPPWAPAADASRRSIGGTHPMVASTVLCSSRAEAPPEAPESPLSPPSSPPSCDSTTASHTSTHRQKRTSPSAPSLSSSPTAETTDGAASTANATSQFRANSHKQKHSRHPYSSAAAAAPAAPAAATATGNRRSAPPRAGSSEGVASFSAAPDDFRPMTSATHSAAPPARPKLTASPPSSGAIHADTEARRDASSVAPPPGSTAAPPAPLAAAPPLTLAVIEGNGAHRRSARALERQRATGSSGPGVADPCCRIPCKVSASPCQTSGQAEASDRAPASRSRESRRLAFGSNSSAAAWMSRRATSRDAGTRSMPIDCRRKPASSADRPATAASASASRLTTTARRPGASRSRHISSRTAERSSSLIPCHSAAILVCSVHAPKKAACSSPLSSSSRAAEKASGDDVNSISHTLAACRCCASLLVCRARSAARACSAAIVRPSDQRKTSAVPQAGRGLVGGGQARRLRTPSQLIIEHAVLGCEVAIIGPRESRARARHY